MKTAFRELNGNETVGNNPNDAQSSEEALFERNSLFNNTKNSHCFVF